MRMINVPMILSRLVVLGILGLFLYPFMPAKQKWQLQAAFGSKTADSLLWEYYRPPVVGAMQFALEFPFAIRAADGRELANRRDVRYVELGESLWRRGEQWVVHLRRDAVDRLAKHLKQNPGTVLRVELDQGWGADFKLEEAQSPLYIDPRLFTDEPGSLVYQAIEDWYIVP